jgi:peptidoglycan/xylan/chitin deacetylase (PgdA/CDA1 family)
VDLPDVGRVRDFVPGAPAGAIALTIDDGPTPQWTPLVLDLLARLGITATFCLVGQQAAEQPRLVRRIAAAGHTIVNHSLTHPLRVPALSTAQLVDEVTTPQKILGDILGHPPTLFRSPGGEWTADLLGVLGDAGLKPLGWNVDPRDWSRPGVAVIESAVLAAAAGDIVLCHDGGGDRSETVQALTDVLPRMRARGLRFVPL